MLNQHDRARAIRRDNRLSWRERVILTELSDYQGNGDRGWKKLSEVAKDLGIDRSNFYRTLRVLGQQGWLHRFKDESGKRVFLVRVPDSVDAEDGVKTTLDLVSEQHQKGVETTPSDGVKTTPEVVSKQHPEGVATTPERCLSDTSSFNAQERPRTPSRSSSAQTREASDASTNHSEPTTTAARPGSPESNLPPRRIPEAFDVLEYHRRHPVVDAVVGAWRDSWRTRTGREYTARPADLLGAGRLAHWLDRHCEANGGDPAEIGARVARDFYQARRDGPRPPSLAWLDPASPGYPFDPEAWLDGPPGPGLAKAASDFIPVSPAEEHERDLAESIARREARKAAANG